MTFGTFLDRASADCGATKGVILYAIQIGKLGDVEHDGAGNRVFTDAHLQRLREYVATPRKRGKKPENRPAVRQEGAPK